MIKRLALTLYFLAALWLVGGATAQDNLPPAAYLTADGLVINGTLIGGNPVAFSHLRWSADGRYLAFQRDGATELHDTATGTTGVVAGDSAYLPPAFSRESGNIFYTANSGQGVRDTASGPAITLTAFERAADGGEAASVGELSFGVGCGGGYAFPMDALYNHEAGFGGRGLIFAVTEFGLLYSTRCTGVGLALLDTATGDNVILGERLSRASLSGDGRRVLAFDEDSGAIIVLNLADGGQQTFNPSAPVDQLAWGTGDGAILYSTRTLSPEPLPLSPEEADAVAAALGLGADGVPQFVASLRRIDVASGAESVLFDEPAWAIGRITASGGAVVFSVISNGGTWVEALATGEVDPFAPDSFMQAWRSAEITVLRVPEAGGTAATLATGAHHITLRP